VTTALVTLSQRARSAGEPPSLGGSEMGSSLIGESGPPRRALAAAEAPAAAPIGLRQNTHAFDLAGFHWLQCGQINGRLL